MYNSDFNQFCKYINFFILSVAQSVELILKLTFSKGWLLLSVCNPV